jgi:5-methyltetrahydrofolate corrinoid/iron sulfur protein methyltransferase
LLVVAEKINGTLPLIAKAVETRDAEFIQDLAVRQAEAGADFIDLNAGTGPEREPDDLVWLVRTVQPLLGVPISLDSAEPASLLAGLEATATPPLINSINGKAHSLEKVLPLVAERCWGVVALLLDDSGIPSTVEQRLAIARTIIANTREAGLADERVFVDPLAMSVSTRQDGSLIALDTMKQLRDEFPMVKFGLGLSNISFGLPARKVINRVFLTLTLAAGLDMALLDPLDSGLQGEMLATELLLGRDRYCRTFTKAFKAGRIT